MNHKITKITNDSDNIKSLNRSLELLKTGNFEESLLIFEEMYKLHYPDTIVEVGIKCCKYWIPKLNKYNSMKEGYEKGKLLFEDWKKFESFINNLKNVQQKIISQIIYFIFNKALESFKKDLQDSKIVDIETTYMIALSYKKIGDYKNAITFFEDILNIDKNNSNTMAELADCYALIDETKKAKILFREAFFIDPSSIELNLLESEFIKLLIDKIEERKLPENELNYWIPVYGRILNVFNVFRDLLPIEFGKLRQEIFYLEKNYVNNEKSENYFKARLLNCYFWLYDYNLLKSVEKEIILEIENKIKNISDEIYSLFKYQ
jgi:tetratricopeptide (TPR) repeat protein